MKMDTITGYADQESKKACRMGQKQAGQEGKMARAYRPNGHFLATMYLPLWQAGATFGTAIIG